MRIKSLFFYFFIPLILIGSLLLVTFTLNVGEKEGKITINQTVISSVFDHYNYEKILLFFGYVGCIDVCTPKLEELASIYGQLTTKEQNSIGILFINLSELDDPKAASLFAEAFNPNFTGIYLDKPQLQALKREFNIYMAPSLSDKDVYDHTSFVYLLEKARKGYNLKTIYTDNLLSQDLMLSDLKRAHVYNE